VHLRGLGRCRVDTGPDRPDRLVGDDELADLLGRQPVEPLVQLPVEHLEGFAPLPLIELPFDELASDIGASGDELLAFAKRHIGGAVRRYVGTLRHRKLGVKENGMVVWQVPDGEVRAAGERLARAPEVSHCYARNPVPNFPYTLYSMVHGPSREDCREIARELSTQTGLDHYAVLFSEREFKKQRLRYFLPELDRWWCERTRERQGESDASLSNR